MILKIFEDKEFDLPLDYSSSDDLITYLDEIFTQYILKIKKHNAKMKLLSDSEIDLITEESKMIIRSLNSQYSGYVHRAYTNLSGTLTKLKDYLPCINLAEYDEAYFYRGRIGDNHEYDIKDLFHIPYEKRSIIQSYRYSIPGYPSLYLANSSYVCWNELRRPNIDSIQINGYKVEKPFKNGEPRSGDLNVLDFGYRPQDICYYYQIIDSKNEQIMKFKHHDSFLQSYDVDRNYFKKYVILWPLIAACSIKVKHDLHPFKPEYIVPQILLQWIRSEKLYDGIRYFSIVTKYRETDTNTENPIEMIHNYVFPTKKHGKTGYCSHLSSLFKSTDPIIWGINETFENNYMMDTKRPLLKELKIEMHNGIFVNYVNTTFYRIEKSIHHMTFKPII